MPRPNIDNEDTLLFSCTCHGNEKLEIYIDKDDNNVWFNIVDYPANFWKTLRWWWKQRKVWSFDMYLTRSDIEALNKKLTEYLKYDRP